MSVIWNVQIICSIVNSSRCCWTHDKNHVRLHVTLIKIIHIRVWYLWKIYLIIYIIKKDNSHFFNNAFIFWPATTPIVQFLGHWPICLLLLSKLLQLLLLAVDLTIAIPFIIILLSMTSWNFNMCKILWMDRWSGFLVINIKHNYLSRNLVFVLYISTASHSLLQQTARCSWNNIIQNEH